MKKSYEEIRTASADALHEMAENGLVVGQKPIRWYLDRCEEMTFSDPGRSAGLLEAILPGLAEPSLKVRAYAWLGNTRRCQREEVLAERAFAAGSAIKGAAEIEYAVLSSLRSLLRAYQDRWSEALADAEKGVRFFESWTGAAPKEYRSLAMALTHRGMIRGWVWDERIDLESLPRKFRGLTFESAHDDYVRAASIASGRKGTTRTALTALANLQVLHSLRWYHDHPVTAADHHDTLRAVGSLRRGLRGAKRRENPVRQRIETLLDYLEGVTRARLSVTLTDAADSLLVRARTGFLERDLVQDAVHVSLDRQWWLLHDDRLGAAITEAREMSEIARSKRASSGLAVLLLEWAERLTNARRLRDEFERIRDLPSGPRHRSLLHRAAYQEALSVADRAVAELRADAAGRLRQARDFEQSRERMEIEIEAEHLVREAGLLEDWRAALGAYVAGRPEELLRELFTLRGVRSVPIPWILIPDPMAVETRGF